MTTNKSTHADCYHDSTKSERAQCRRERAQAAQVEAPAHAARLIRAARNVGQYGIDVSEPALDYARFSRVCARSSTMCVVSAKRRRPEPHEEVCTSR